jgi:serine/threonine-protein kinase
VQLAAGQMVTEHVRLMRPLGEGGMGSLWVAEHLVERKEVAVKFVWKQLAESDPQILERFQREAKTLTKLSSPHVVKLYARGMADADTPFIVMELLHGETLVDRLERTGPLPLADVGFVVSQIAAGLDHVHGQNIVHRDLKGENIFLLGDERQPLVKILDFGLAKPPGAPGEKKLTAAGTMIGTAEYMSPEQILSAKDVDQRADLWAFAVLTYIMLAASLPFKGTKMSEVLMAIRMSQFTPPSALLDGLPSAVDEWFTRCFHMDLNQRFQTAAEMNQAWQMAITAAPAKAPSEQGFPMWAIVTLLALGVLTVFGALYFLI